MGKFLIIKKRGTFDIWFVTNLLTYSRAGKKNGAIDTWKENTSYLRNLHCILESKGELMSWGGGGWDICFLAMHNQVTLEKSPTWSQGVVLSECCPGLEPQHHTAQVCDVQIQKTLSSFLKSLAMKTQVLCPSFKRPLDTRGNELTCSLTLSLTPSCVSSSWRCAGSFGWATRYQN